MAEIEGNARNPGFFLGAGLVVAGTAFNVAGVADPVGFVGVVLGAAVLVEALLRGA